MIVCRPMSLFALRQDCLNRLRAWREFSSSRPSKVRRMRIEVGSVLQRIQLETWHLVGVEFPRQVWPYGEVWYRVPGIGALRE